MDKELPVVAGHTIAHSVYHYHKKSDPSKHNTIAFARIITTSEINPLSVAVGNKGHDCEEEHF